MQPDPRPSPPADAAQSTTKPVARIYFACANRYITVLDGRPDGSIARCPQCGRSNRLPPRTETSGDRFFEIAC